MCICGNRNVTKTRGCRQSRSDIAEKALVPATFLKITLTVLTIVSTYVTATETAEESGSSANSQRDSALLNRCVPKEAQILPHSLGPGLRL